MAETKRLNDEELREIEQRIERVNFDRLNPFEKEIFADSLCVIDELRRLRKEKSKVVIPRKVAEAIENMRKRWEDKALVQFENYESPTIDSYPELRIIKNYFGLPHSSDNFTELMRALVNGYEVERTPHERLREFYYDYWNHGWNASFHAGVRLGVERTLEILGITVEGINDGPTGSDRE